MRSVDIAVTGIGCVSALGENFSRCMHNLFAGSAHQISSSAIAADLPEELVLRAVDDSRVAYPPHLQERGRTAQLAAVAAAEAFASARLERSLLAGKRVGVCVGTTVGNTLNNLEMYRQYRSGTNPGTGQMERYFRSNPADVLAEEFSLSGPRLTVANACSSGADAIGIGASWLRAGICDVVLAGGCDELSQVSITGFNSLMIASSKPCRPFDRDRDGLNLGEGAAMLVLERGQIPDRPLCFLEGYGTACDAYHVTAPHPEGKGLKLALTQAMAEADVLTEELAFINAHGTGTFDNDRVEMQVFDEMFREIPYFSVKGVTGHTLGGAGAIEAALTCGCLLQGEIPASHGFANPPDAVKNLPTKKNRSLRNNIAISQSLAFGGNNSVLVFRLLS